MKFLYKIPYFVQQDYSSLGQNVISAAYKF